MRPKPGHDNYMQIAVIARPFVQVRKMVFWRRLLDCDVNSFGFYECFFFQGFNGLNIVAFDLDSLVMCQKISCEFTANSLTISLSSEL